MDKFSAVKINKRVDDITEKALGVKALCGRCSFWHMGLCDGSRKSCWVDGLKEYELIEKGGF